MIKNSSHHQSHSTSLLRVGSGKYKGIKLNSPQSALTHPMGSREKLALFNMLHDFVPEATVLDAYAGSGALGIEALSRGAKKVVFVERSPKVARTLKENLERLPLEAEQVTAVFSETVRAFAERPEYQGAFELIIADPPYDAVDVDDLRQLTRLLRLDGIFALSFPADQPLPQLVELELISEHTYAGANIAIYRHI